MELDRRVNANLIVHTVTVDSIKCSLVKQTFGFKVTKELVIVGLMMRSQCLTVDSEHWAVGIVRLCFCHNCM